ncbi:endonuclease/exonuclease/phosphatase family protein [Paractinoplanes atraurantiacus]|uniref:Metal-dependent hydrolase, endonuclease/exonuclease/phosphatase family n=1 Tax=Paractinoplanes atraurantiacus TaxID=1036182 RepID=A0A285KQS2_9ACTN|nr:endonuclease/exonuclease/phosphatase family protein [Actinoplanes atraurantiacus]SNY74970.1 Metal-dependent hydrolase, endonuclease/exonuclease/phosphatase family [Actinoplanes atraurantiacus]
MRVLAWNLWWRFGGAWREREAGIVATLRTVQPDLAGFCETWAGEGTTQPQLLADRLGLAHAAFAPTSLPPVPVPPEEPSQAGIEMGIGLISRWALSEVTVHELPHPQRAGPPPTALSAVVDGRFRAIVTCIEWEPRYAQDQMIQARTVAELATASDLPVLVLGDLNAAVDQPEMAPLLAALTDTWQAAGADPNAVTLSSAVPQAPLEATKQIDRRIDHILARTNGPLAVGRAFLAGNHPINGHHPSDHFAVVTDLSL